MNTAPSPAGGLTAALPGARIALATLLFINLVNYIDRYNLSAVEPKVRLAYFAEDDPRGKAYTGFLATAFMVSYMISAPLFGWAADRMSRWLLIAIGVAIWSLATGLSGMATVFWVMFLARCFVGIGEGAYGPAAPTIIADLYPVARRGYVIAWFYMAIPVGSALGYVLGGHIAEAQFLLDWGVAAQDRWRWAFYFMVPPGLLLAVWCLFLRDPPRGQADPGAQAVKVPFKEASRIILRTKSYWLDTLGMTFMAFAVGGVAFWMPTYIYEREKHYLLDESAVELLRKHTPPVPAAVLDKLKPLHEVRLNEDADFLGRVAAVLTPAEMQAHGATIKEAARQPRLGNIGLIFGAITAVAGLTATLLGGLAGDYLRPRMAGSYFWVSGVGMIIGFVFFLGVLYVPFPWAWVCIFIAEFFLFFNTGPTNTIMANVIHPSMRGTAVALNILIIHALGDAISPFVIGLIAGYSDLTMGFLVVSGMILLSGLVWLRGTRYLEEDTRLAPTRVAGESSPPAQV